MAYDDYDSLKKTWETFHDLCQAGKVCSAWAVGSGGLAEGIMKMSFGNRVGFEAEPSAESSLFYTGMCGAILAECDGPAPGGVLVGRTTSSATIFLAGEAVPVDQLLAISEGVLEEVYPTRGRHPRQGGAHLLDRPLSRSLRPQDGPAPGGHPRVPRHQLRVRHRRRLPAGGH